MGYSIEDFLEIRSAVASGFSPDGSKVLLGSNLTGTMQLYRAGRDGADLSPVTTFEEPVTGRYLPHRDEVLLHVDEGGNERLQLHLVADDGSSLRPVVSDLEFIHRAGGVTRDGSLLAYASNRRNGVDFDVYVRHLESGEERCVFSRGGWCSAAGFSPDGHRLAVHRLTNRNMDNEIHLVDVDSGDVSEVCPHDEEAHVGGPQWLPDGRAFFFSTDIGRDVCNIALYDMRKQSWRYVIDSDWDADCWIDWPGTKLLVGTNEDGYTRFELFEPRKLKHKASLPLPGRGVAEGAITAPEPHLSRDGRYISYTFVSEREAGDVWLHDTTTGETTRITRSPHEIPREEFVEPSLHRVMSFDGEKVPIFLYRPRGVDNPPVVVFVHGGPESQYRPVFNPLIQYLAHRGLAVVAPNVRGSTGYGKRYHHLDDVRKRLDSVADLAAVHSWLPSAGLDPGRAALWGGSYGGYMVLAGLTFQPGLWAAGVSVVGISSLVTFLENTSPWRRSFREREYGSLENDILFLHEVSPLTHIDRLRAPLFLIHGANDPRVPVTEAHQVHAALAQKGIPTELLVYDDEGHGLSKLKNRLDAYPKAVDFLTRVLRGSA